MTINQKWLDAIGEDVPTTVEELYTVLEKFAEAGDLNGNGVADEIPSIGKDNIYRTDLDEFIINAFVYCEDDYFFNVTDGEVWVPYTTDEYREALIYLNKLYQEGLFSPLFYSIANDVELASLASPESGVGNVGVIAGHPTIVFKTDNEALYEYVPLLPLESATDIGGWSPMMSNTFRYSVFITTDAEDPELCFKFLDFWSSKEGAIRTRYGVLGEHWEYAEEGDISNLGIPATIKVLDDSVWNGTNNFSYHLDHGTIKTQSWFGVAWEDDGSWTSYRSKMIAEIFNGYMAGKRPDEIIQTLVYTTEEQETATEFSSQIRDYMSEARALFISGVSDPNDDSQWEKYLDEMEARGLNDYIALAQAVYNRMNSY